MEANPAVLSPSRPGRSRLFAKARSVATSTWTLGVFVFCLSWGGGLVAPHTVSVDDSLHAGLNMAAVHGLEFGSDIVFTYGPLGFLKSYLVFYEWPARLAALYGIGLHLTLAVSLVWALRRNFGIVVTLVVATVAAMLMRGDLGAVGVRDDAGVIAIATIWCIAVLAGGAPEWARRLLLYGGGPFAAIEVLAKLNTGLIVVAIAAIAVVAMDGDRRRNVATFAATFAIPLVLLWFATGQSAAAVGPFLSGSWEIISGYSSGARLDWETRDYDYVLIPLIILGAGAIAWVSSATLPRPRRLALGAVFAIVAFTAAKGGLVSHDEYHMATFFGTMVALAIAFPLPERVVTRAGGLVVTVAILVAGFTAEYPGYPLTNPFENVRNAGETIGVMVDGDRLREEVAGNRTALASAYGVDERSLGLLEGHGVHVDPSETAAAWAYELEWDPLPVFQPYAAWTEELDRLNADTMASAEGPDRILRQNLNALGRFPSYESPAAMLAMLCNFEPLRTTQQWQVLGRVPDRCGEPRAIGTVEATYGERIEVPPAPPGDTVFARVEGIQVAGLERLRAMVQRAGGRQVRFFSDEGLPASLVGTPSPDGGYIFLPETAAGGLLLRAPSAADSPDPFRLSPEADRFSFLLNREASPQVLDVEFFAMPIEPRSR